MSGKAPNDRAPLEAALSYARAGWPVFPIAPLSKVPAFPAAHPGGSPEAAQCQGECGRLGHGFHDATTDPELIREWWGGRNEQRNVGIATGAPGPDVLDVDVKKEGNGFAALNRIKRAGLADGQQAIVTTPSTGMHLYYRGTDQHNGADRVNHIDFRSKGGYVVAPPSVTDVGRYAVVQHHAQADATLDWGAVRDVLEPPELRQQRELAAQARQQFPDRNGGRGDEGRVGRLTNFVAQGKEGDRNFRVFYAAKQLTLHGQLDATAIESLVSAARTAGLRGGEREARRSIASGVQNALREGGRASGQPQAGDGGGPGRPFGPSGERERGREAG